MTCFRDGMIVSIHERITGGTDRRVVDFLTRHDAALRAPGAGFVDPGAEEIERLDAAVAASVVRCYGAAKSEQDIGAALAVCTDDFVIETDAFGITSRDRADTAAQLELFFYTFPDYAVEIDGMTGDGAAQVCWGTASMTFSAPVGDIAPTGRSVRLPFLSLFEITGGRIRRERFVFDLATLCRGIGVETAAMEAALGLGDSRPAQGEGHARVDGQVATTGSDG